jgi:hypothetical protein
MGDAQVTVRFYTVFPLEPGQPSFEACLQKVLALGENPVRKVDGTDIQASNLKEAGGRISGDILRLQDDNLPSLVNRGNKPEKMSLKRGVALGHHAAFLYDPALKILCFQLTRNAVPLSLFNGFITSTCDCKPFGFGPVIKPADLKQLAKMTPKTMIIKVADPKNLEAIEDDQKKLRTALLNLRTLADGAYVRVQIGLGNHLGELNKSRVISSITWLLGQRDVKKGKVFTVQVVGKDVNDEDLPLDFIKAQIGESKNLTLGKALGPDENYKTRSEFLLASLEKHTDELKNFHHVGIKK